MKLNKRKYLKCFIKLFDILKLRKFDKTELFSLSISLKQ